MKLISLRGENWGQHSKINITFKKNNWIKGPNDSGKTTIIRAIQFCLDTTAGAARSHGQGYALKEGTENGWLELSFEFGNQIHTIQKNFSVKGAASTKVDNKSMTLSDAAEEFKKLGMPPSSQLIGLSILSQGQMHSIISEKPASRMIRINELMGMDPVKNLRKKVKKQKDYLQTKKEGLLAGGIDETYKEEQLVEEKRNLDLEKEIFSNLEKPEVLNIEKISHEYDNLKDSTKDAEKECLNAKNNVVEWAKPWAEEIYQENNAPSAQTLIDRAEENILRKKSNLARMKTITKFKIQESKCSYAKNVNTHELQSWITQIDAESKIKELLQEFNISEEEALIINLDKITRSIQLEKQEYKNLEATAFKIHTYQNSNYSFPLNAEKHLEALWEEMEKQEKLGNPWKKDPLTGDIIDIKLVKECKIESQNRYQKHTEKKEIQEFFDNANKIEETKNKEITTILEIIKTWEKERNSIKDEYKNNQFINAVNKFRNINSQKEIVSDEIRKIININDLQIFINSKKEIEKLPEALKIGKEIFNTEDEESKLRIFELKYNIFKSKKETLKNTSKPENSYPTLNSSQRIKRINDIEKLKESYTEHRISIKNHETQIKKLETEILQIKNRKSNVETLQNTITRLNDTYEFLDSKNGPQTVINSLFLKILENANNILNNVGANIELISDENLNLYAGNPIKTDPDNYPPSNLLGFGKATLCGVSLTLALREFYNEQNPGSPINLLIADEPSAFVEKHILPQLYKELNGSERDSERMMVIVEHDPLVESVCQKIIEAPFFEKNNNLIPKESNEKIDKENIKDLLLSTIIE